MLNARMLLSILITGCIWFEANAISEFVTEMISAGIEAGASLAGTSVNALMASGYRVAVAGSLENYTKWPMIYQTCTLDRGYFNKPMVNIDPGKKEGFGSHKADSSTAGSWVYCYYKINGKRIHIMYSAPFNFDHYYNKMALAITRSNISLNANNMYYNDYNYMDRKTYYKSVIPVEICRQGLCFKGVMGTSHQPIITVKLYPHSFDNIAPSIKKSLEKVDDAKAKYDEFIREEFHDA